MQRIVLVLSSVVLASACMASGMGGGQSQMSEALSSARDEVSRHGDLCDRAPTMADVESELQRHQRGMSSIMDRMDGAMDDLHAMRCSGGHMASMMGTVSNMRTAVGDHATRLAGIDDVSRAHDECTRYRGNMLGLCAAARRDNDGMGCM